MPLLRLLGQALTRPLDKHFARCLLCGTADEVQAGICAPCQCDLPSLGHACVRCALPLAETQDRHCAACIQRPPPQASSVACWSYAYPVAQLVQRFKYQRDFAAGRTLAELAAQELHPHILQAPRIDILVPIPMHWRKQLFGRGYNQAQLIADIFGSYWRIPVAPGALRKVAASDSQQTLSRAQRRKNLIHSFAAGRQIQDLHVGLVDDVITTGATQEAASQSLLAAGASRVSVYALARTP
ncbi:ComF family protein [Microbulbifer agarilyticus]|uniref:ComF family protein n=1 Tax=Microbulbifer agarilyticus TaxID=260552 RepID=UPI001C97B5BD|nr:ComF family protein [Microbulbifer agarilyticus]MBY6191176.1 ComF family protein [Microbulbifer agarilyticus]